MLQLCEVMLGEQQLCYSARGLRRALAAERHFHFEGTSQGAGPEADDAAAPGTKRKRDAAAGGGGSSSSSSSSSRSSSNGSSSRSSSIGSSSMTSFPFQLQLAVTIPKQPGSANQGLHRDGDLSLLDLGSRRLGPHRSNGEGRTTTGPSEEQTKRRREGERDDVGEDNKEDEKDERDEDSGAGGGLIFAMSTIWALDGAFTAARGTTRVVPGSHTWATPTTGGDDKDGGGGGAGGGGGGGTSAAVSRRAEAQAVSAEMARGSCLIYTGQTWHGAGHNSTTAPRLALNFAYQSACLKQEENMYTAYPPAVARRFPEHLRRLVGYFSDF